MQDLMINKKRDLPGPGQYSPKDRMSKDGIYTISGMKNTKTLGFKSSDRFKTMRSSLPGPGDYQIPSSINSKGQYFVSTIRNSGVGFFGAGSRQNELLKPSSTPGPGWYDAPSELGFMEKNLIK